MTYKNPGPQSFSAIIQGTDNGGAFVEFPYDVQELYGVKGRVPVIATFENKVKYKGSMTKMGLECHLLIILKQIRAEIGKQPGDTVSVTVELDTKNREVEVPSGTKKALKASSTALEKFQKLSYSHQKEYIDWINEAKHPETRERRIKKLIDTLSAEKY